MSKKVLGKPESHSDVINKHPRTLLIGYGWVGQFVHKYFTEADYYTPESGIVSKNPPPKNDSIPKYYWDVGFINVPSPMNPDGSCDISIVQQVVEEWHYTVKLFIIRSTVKPGTTKKLQEEYPDNLFVMQPEYLGETLGHPLIEPNRQTFIILGGNKEATQKAAEAWMTVLHSGSKIRQVNGKTAELCKYMENSWNGLKVTFVSDWGRLVKNDDEVDFLELREAWLDDPRISRSHTFAYPNNPGFSGKCLPKDINAIVHYARHEAGQPLELMEEVLKINAEMRKHIKTTTPLLPEK